jgi:hypothetical protein
VIPGIDAVIIVSPVRLDVEDDCGCPTDVIDEAEIVTDTVEDIVAAV